MFKKNLLKKEKKEKKRKYIHNFQPFCRQSFKNLKLRETRVISKYGGFAIKSKSITKHIYLNCISRYLTKLYLSGFGVESSCCMFLWFSPTEEKKQKQL